jgi:hypothetical protein
MLLAYEMIPLSSTHNVTFVWPALSRAAQGRCGGSGLCLLACVLSALLLCTRDIGDVGWSLLQQQPHILDTWGVFCDVLDPMSTRLSLSRGGPVAASGLLS